MPKRIILKSLPILLIIIAVTSQNAFSQLEMFFDEDDFYGIDFIPNSIASKAIFVSNLSDTTVLFNWEFTTSSGAEEFIRPQFSDLNLEFIPSVMSNCDLNLGPNVIGPNDTIELRLNVEMFDTYVNNEILENLLVTVNLLTDPDCDEVFTSIDVPFFFFITSNTNIDPGNLKMYPNPVNDQLNIVGLYPKDSRYTISNINGKIFSHHKLVGHQISTQHLPKGLYFLKIESQNQIWTGRFIKQD